MKTGISSNLLILVIILLASATVVNATTFFIANGDVAGLKNAMNTANSNNDNDVINLATNGLYILTSIDNGLADGNGLPVIENDVSTPGPDLIIDGHGARIQRSSNPSTPKFRILQVGVGASCILENLTLENGHALPFIQGAIGTGGAIFNDNGSVTCVNCGIYLSVAEGWSAPAVFYGTAADGTRAWGGAIYNNGTLQLTDCTLNSNVALGGAGGSQTGSGPGGDGGDAAGGAIYSTAVGPTLTRCTFLGNSARGGRGGNGAQDGDGGWGGDVEGGAVYSGAAITATDCAFTSDDGIGGNGGNAEQGYAGEGGWGGNVEGGAVRTNNGQANFDGCTFETNSGTGGAAGSGALGGDPGPYPGNVSGGAVSTQDIVISDCTFRSNSADGSGGISIGGGSNLVMNCLFDSNTAETAGAIGFGGETLSIKGTQFLNNTAHNQSGYGYTGGGAIAFSPPSQLTIEDSTFRGNVSDIFGGAIFIEGHGGNPPPNGLTVERCLFAENLASRGGVIGADLGGDITINVTNSTCSGNQASYNGGAMYLDRVGNCTITSTTFAGNTCAAGYQGGTFYVNASGGTAHLTLGSSILKAGSSGANIAVYGTGATIVSLGHNISSDAAGGNSATGPGGYLNAVGDLRNTDPRLGVLAANGGPTETHALMSGSPAINHGAPGPERDQRSYLRNGVPDSGAFEFSASLAPVTAGSMVNGQFGVEFPLTGTVGIEPRRPGTGGNFQIVMDFATPVTASGASVTSGTGSATLSGINGSEVTVNLTNVANAQQIVVTLTNVSDGVHTNNVNIPAGFLQGDTNGNGVVNASDVSQTKSRVGQPIDSSNFRCDVNGNGTINASDVSVVKSKIGTSVP
jgi:hypothetical protein